MEDDETLPAHFARLFPEDRVLNHGESGFVSRQELARLVNLVSLGEPMDLVVFYDGFNDAVFLCAYGIALDGHSQAALIDAAVAPPSRFFETLVGPIRELVRRTRRSAGGVRAPPFATPLEAGTSCQQDRAQAGRVADALIASWELARQAATLAGAEFVAVLQPVAAVGSPRTDHLDLDDGIAREVAAMYETVRERIRARQAPWIRDLTAIFDAAKTDDAYLYIDPCHVSSAGNRIAAKAIADRLQAGP